VRPGENKKRGIWVKVYPKVRGITIVAVNVSLPELDKIIPKKCKTQLGFSGGFINEYRFRVGNVFVALSSLEVYFKRKGYLYTVKKYDTSPPFFRNLPMLTDMAFHKLGEITQKRIKRMPRQSITNFNYFLLLVRDAPYLRKVLRDKYRADVLDARAIVIGKIPPNIKESDLQEIASRYRGMVRVWRR